MITLSLFSACGNKDKGGKKMAEAHYKMSLSHFNENNITAALKELLLAYEYDPENYDINHLLGIAYLNKNDYINAEKYLKEAIRLKSDSPKAYNNLGIIYLETKRYDDAIEQFNKAAGNILYETPEVAYNYLGWAYYKKGDFVQAKKAYEKSIELETRYFFSHFNFGLLLFDLKKYDDAVKEYKEAIKSSQII
jgi:Tfp pilus assembly protein PilF